MAKHCKEGRRAELQVHPICSAPCLQHALCPMLLQSVGQLDAPGRQHRHADQCAEECWLPAGLCVCGKRVGLHDAWVGNGRCAWWQVAAALPLHIPASSHPINQLVCLVGKSWIAPLRLPPQPTRCVLPHHQMSYDAGDANTTGYNPVEAIQAYCSYHPCNRVLGGIQIPPEVSVPARLPRMLPHAVWVGPQPAGGQAGADLTAGLTRHGLIAGMGRR